MWLYRTHTHLRGCFLLFYIRSPDFTRAYDKHINSEVKNFKKVETLQDAAKPNSCFSLTLLTTHSTTPYNNTHISTSYSTINLLSILILINIAGFSYHQNRHRSIFSPLLFFKVYGALCVAIIVRYFYLLTIDHSKPINMCELYQTFIFGMTGATLLMHRLLKYIYCLLKRYHSIDKAWCARNIHFSARVKSQMSPV